jgi:hypothetical protein
LSRLGQLLARPELLVQRLALTLLHRRPEEWELPERGRRTV